MKYWPGGIERRVRPRSPRTALNWTASVTYQGGSGWLTLNPNVGLNNGTIRVDAQPQKLAPGTYNAIVTVDGGVAGVKRINCYRRALAGKGQGHTIQWTFSDGLPSVSLFLEPYDAQRKPREVLLALGATFTLTRRLADKDGDWWLTAVGEVPPETLDAFAQSLTRAR